MRNKLYLIVLLGILVLLLAGSAFGEATGCIKLTCLKGYQLELDSTIVRNIQVDGEIYTNDNLSVGAHKLRIFEDGKEIVNMIFVISNEQIFALDMVKRQPPNSDDSNKDTDTLMNMTDVDLMPEMIKYNAPEYPFMSRTNEITGVVWINALVNTEGKVIDAKVKKSSGVSELDNSALKAAYGNKFSPAKKDGKAVNCWIEYKVEFTLDK